MRCISKKVTLNLQRGYYVLDRVVRLFTRRFGGSSSACSLRDLIFHPEDGFSADIQNFIRTTRRYGREDSTLHSHSWGLSNTNYLRNFILSYCTIRARSVALLKKPKYHQSYFR
jgi:hypothetical protein